MSFPLKISRDVKRGSHKERRDRKIRHLSVT